MNKTEYIEQRNALVAAAEELIGAGNAEEANTKMAEVEALDNKWESVKLANANLNALKDNVKTIDLENKSIEMQEGKKVAKITNLIEENNIENLVKTDEYKNAWLKNLQGKDLTQQENAVISAASVIPTSTLDKITEKLEQTALLYSKITVSHIPGNLTLPRENAKADASWVAMGTAATDDADSFDYVSLGAMKLIKTIEIGADVMAMSIPSFENYIVNALVKKMNKAIENSILNGTGTTNPVGLLLAGQVTNTGTFTKAGMTYKDLMTIIAALPTSYHPNATFVTTRALFFGDILGMLDANGKPVVVADPQSPSKFNILGYPVVIDDYCVADKILFGDLSYYHMNWAQEISIAADNSVGFRNGSTVYRGLALADGKPTLAEAFTLYSRAA